MTDTYTAPTSSPRSPHAPIGRYESADPEDRRNDKQYDFLIVGAGLYGAAFANRAKRDGLKCLVIEKKNDIGGMLNCIEIEGITVHKYGPHIFHTSDKEIWDYICSLVEMQPYLHQAKSLGNDGELYQLPFNMNTFEKLWGVKTPEEAKAKIEEQKADAPEHPRNLEDQAIAMVGKDIYELLVKGYNEKQWGRPCNMLPSFLIKRIPLRYSYDNNYFQDTYTGVPKGGYNKLINKMLEGVEVRLGTDYFANRDELNSLARHVVFTGKIDEFFDYRFGRLDYRSMRFEPEIIDKQYALGCAVITDNDPTHDHLRVTEHKYFHPECATNPKTVIVKEYPVEYHEGMDALYPVNDVRNMAIYARYHDLANREMDVSFGGRLAEYTYYDMAPLLKKVFSDFSSILSHLQ